MAGFQIPPVYTLWRLTKNYVHHTPWLWCVWRFIPRSAVEARRLTPNSYFYSPTTTTGTTEFGYDLFTEDTGSKPVGGITIYNWEATVGRTNATLFFTSPLPPFFPSTSTPLFLPPLSLLSLLLNLFFYDPPCLSFSALPLLSPLLMRPFKCNTQIDIQWLLCISIYA